MITKTEKEIYKEIENIWDNIIQKDNRLEFIKSLNGAGVSLENVTLRKCGLDIDLWKSMDLDSTTNEALGILNNQKIFYSLPFIMYGTGSKRTFEFFDREHPIWINALGFNKYGRIEYSLMSTIKSFEALKEYIDSIRPIDNPLNKKELKELESEKSYFEALESFLEFSKNYGKEIFDKYCEQSLTFVE